MLRELKKLESFKKKDYRKSLTDLFLQMDVILLSKEGKREMAKFRAAESGVYDEEGESMAGATCCVALITKTEIYCGNAGDTRCVLSKKGKSKDLSIDHKPTMATEKRRIERAGGFVEEDRVNGMLALSRAIGDFEYKQGRTLKPED